MADYVEQRDAFEQVRQHGNLSQMTHWSAEQCRRIIREIEVTGYVNHEGGGRYTATKAGYEVFSGAIPCR